MPIRKGDGTGVGSIRLGDGTGIAEVRKGDGTVVFSSADAGGGGDTYVPAGGPGWDMYGNDLENTRVTSGATGLDGTLTERWIWNDDFGTDIGRIVAAAAIDPENGWIYTFSKDGDVVQIDTATGSTVTVTSDVFNNDNGAVTAFHFTDWTTAYGVCQSNSALYKFDVDPTGGGVTNTTQLYAPSGGTFDGVGPTVHNDIAYWVGQDGDAKVWAYDLAANSLAWSQQLCASGNGTVERAVPTVVPENNAIYTYAGDDFDSSTPRIAAWDLANGTQKWAVEPTNNQKYSNDNRVTFDNSAGYDASTDRLVVGNRSSYIYCIDATTGEYVWEYEIDEVVCSAPTIYEGWAYFWLDENRIIALNTNSGEAELVIMPEATGNGQYYGLNTVQSSNGTVLVACGNDRLDTYDPNTGALVDSVNHSSGVQMFSQSAELGVAVTGEYEIQVWET